jgi:hypothetical protein
VVDFYYRGSELSSYIKLIRETEKFMFEEIVFEVLNTVKMPIVAFWVLTQCRLGDDY